MEEKSMVEKLKELMTNKEEFVKAVLYLVVGFLVGYFFGKKKKG